MPPTFSNFETAEPGIVEGRREQYAPTPNSIPPAVTGLTVTEANAPDVDGSMPLRFVLDFQRPRWWGVVGYDVFAKNTTNGDSDFKFLASIQGPNAVVAHPYLGYIGSTYTFSVVAKSSAGRGLAPEDAAQTTLAPQGLGIEVGDVTGFVASAHCCDVTFAWTALTEPWFEYYEIRQGVSWAAGTVVLVIGPSPRTKASVHHADLPIALSTSATFHIKVISRTRAEGLTEATDTLTALEIATVEMPCCAGGREIALSPGDTFVDVTTVRPFLNQPFPIPGDAGPNVGGGSLRSQGGSVDPTTFVQGGDNTWTYRVYLDDVAVTGDVFHIVEIG